VAGRCSSCWAQNLRSRQTVFARQAPRARGHADSRGSVPVVGGLSLGAKFVGLTAGLIVLLSLTAFISLRNSAETVRQIGSVVDFAIPAYGALARSHIRSLEQAVELRRSLLLAEDPAVTDSAIAEHAQAFLEAQTEFHREVADAEGLLKSQRDSTSSERVAAGLQRLTEALTGLRPLTETYEKETAACLAGISARSLPEARQRLVTIDRLRQELGGRLEAVRAGMFTTLKAISKEAEAAQARARMATIVVFLLSSISWARRRRHRRDARDPINQVRRSGCGGGRGRQSRHPDRHRLPRRDRSSGSVVQ
jgi:hypothetical protein